MDGVEFLPVEVGKVLERGTVIVTANQRAARTLGRAYDLQCRARGLTSWRPPQILAWDAWTARLWRGLLIEGKTTQLLLNRSQEHTVWRTVLGAEEDLVSLKTVDALAEMASDAWSLLCRYGDPQRLRGSGGSSDARAFQRWAATFERVCRSESLITVVQLEDTLREAVEAGWLQAPAAGIALLGSDSITPSQTKLIDSLRTHGCDIKELVPEVSVKERLLVPSENEHSEVSLAARWIRTFMETHPKARIGVIVPGLETQRREIDRVFREVLSPELQDIRAGNDAGPFEFSLGIPLAETPQVRVALDLLRWAAGSLSLERVSNLLLSPYVGDGVEHEARAEFDAFELRRAWMLRPELGLEEMISLVERAKRRSRLGVLLGSLRRMLITIDRTQALTGTGSHAEWATRMRELLDAAGWAAGQNESSVEFQTRRRWESALDEMATLDFDGEKVEFGDALKDLEQISRKTMFAPESREAPVQILGPLEAAGSTFDAVWFLRTGELNWPVTPTGSSLLAWPLQRDLGMPGTDVARDFADARWTTERIAASAPTVIFSYAVQTTEGRQRASPVLAGMAFEETTPESLAGVEPARAVVAVEEIQDAAPIAALPDRVLRGGAHVLELQAACGFRAFAEHRLWASEVDNVTLGMDARQSGTVLHRALELFWREVRTQDRLRGMSEAERGRALGESIERALAKTAAAATTEWDDAYVAMQTERLNRLLARWITIELERGLPFEVRESEEEFRDVRVGPLRLSVRMDRVDVVEGGEVLIDYKTGTSAPKDWLGVRPDAPQLPLYAILSDPDRLQGVAFGVVRAGKEMGLKGFATETGIVPKPARMDAPTFEAQVEQWHQVLENLAVEFAEGDARVRPKQYPSTCKYCGQRLLCRLDATLMDTGDDEALEDDRG